MRISTTLVATVVGLVLAFQAKAYIYKLIDLRTVESATQLCEKRGYLKSLEVVMTDMAIAYCGNGQKFVQKSDGVWVETTRRKG